MGRQGFYFEEFQQNNIRMRNTYKSIIFIFISFFILKCGIYFFKYRIYADYTYLQSYIHISLAQYVGNGID